MGPGFFGKLRSHGDFVSRRFPQAVLQPFDAWLQAAMVQSRVDLGQAWLPTYLESPLWRFVLAPGVAGPQAWAGIMMPSADRVGRCFPLTLATGLDGVPGLADCMGRHAGWFVQLEDLALSTLEDGFSLEAFDAALQVVTGAPGATPVDGAFACTGRVASALNAGLMTNADLDGCSAWWTDGSQQVAPTLALCPGLPAVTSFAALLDGQWSCHGWPRG